MIRFFLTRAWLPAVVAGSSCYFALTREGWSQAFAVGLLTATSFAFWLACNILTETSETAWKPMALDAARGLIVTTAYTDAVAGTLGDALDYIEMDDPETARRLRSELADATAQYTEHV